MDQGAAEGRAQPGDSLFSEGENCWQACEASRFGWAIDGENYFRELRESLEGAEREILIVGWDIDSRLELIRDRNHPYYPSPLRKTLEDLVDRRDALEIYVLSWDFAVLYVLERELLPARAFGWQNSKRLHFELDGRHTTGASHHQKLVVIDGAVAWVGGFDLTKARWDTRAHADDEPRRVDPAGSRYRPFHDVQAVVSGPAATRLRSLASLRWEHATGDALPDLDEASTDDVERIWPESAKVRARDVPVAVARTWTGEDGDAGIREVEQLYLDMIASARQYIYLENQYFTSLSIAAALAERLRETDGPEMAVVLPGETSGWLEQATMDLLRNQALKTLIDADEHRRLRILAPTSTELTDMSINVHAKVMVADGRWARIGSANLSRRSMGLDSECDIVVDGSGAATALCADLLAEHLGTDFERVAGSLTDIGLLATIDEFNGGARHLRPITVATDDWAEVLEPLAKVADLEQPLLRSTARVDDASPDGREEDETVDTRGTRTPVTGWLFLVLVVAIGAFWLFLAIEGAGGEIDPWQLLETLREGAAHPLAPVAMAAAIVIGSLVVAPITGMIAISALLFTPWTASVAAIVGTLGATVVNHWIGSHFGKLLSDRIPRPVADKIERIATSSDMWHMAGLRLIPVAPFSIVNVVVGASGVRMRDFLMGTLISMGPGIVLICLSIDRARAALRGEPIFDPWAAAAIVGAGVALIGLRTWLKRESR